MAFFQEAPRLSNSYDHDPLLREYHARRYPPDLLAALEPEYRHLGALAAGPLYDAMLADLDHEPRLVPWNAWGHRVDDIELTSVWAEGKKLTAEHGFVAAAYEQKQGALSRIHQFSLNYVVQASLDVYSCPLAMTDGAARTLLELENRALIDRALPHLTSRDASQMWTSGQWMTERTGGSDVGISETVARRDGEHWRLFGTKWFTSATTSEMALTLARPEGNPAGGRGLALFYVETRGADGRLNGIQINRLKDKLGTRKVPTAELALDGTLATPVAGTSDGVRNISSMLNITRTWNAVAAAWGMRRGLALAQDYAKRRVAFGKKLSEKPLHVDTLAQIAAETEAAFHLSFRAVELIGKLEAKEINEHELRLLRVLTPITKLTTAKQAVAAASEAIETFGGAGYVEDTGLPRLLADAQVLPIWEGTTNVLSLDTLRALDKEGTLEALAAEIRAQLATATRAELAPVVAKAEQALGSALSWLSLAREDIYEVEAGARRFALTMGRTLELALLASHASWCLDHNRGPRALAAARVFARRGVDLVDRTKSGADERVLAAGADVA